MRYRLFAALWLMAVSSGAAFAQDAPGITASSAVTIVSPADGEQVVSRRPEIRVSFSGATPSELLVMVDGVDVTPLVERSPGGFVYRPVRALPSGAHQVMVSTRNVDGSVAQALSSFSSRHGETILEAYSNNELGYSLDLAAATHQYPANQAKQRLEGIFRTDSRFRSERWQFSFAGSLRQLEQDVPLAQPLSRGIDAVGWLLSLGYSGDSLSAEARFGDIQVNETGYTVANLARRGGDLAVSYEKVRLRAFNVAGRQLYGFQGGTGLGTDSDRHVSGGSASITLLDGRVEVKGVTATGGETSGSYNIGTIGGEKKGSVTGGQVNTDFFGGAFKTEIEGARARFDTDSSDTVGSRSDTAWRFKAGGGIGSTSYDLQYERVGRDYASIGNLTGIPRDRQGGTARGSLILGSGSLTAFFSRYADNIQDDPDRSRIINYQGGIDYSCGVWPSLPLGLSWQSGLQKSQHEPLGVAEVELQTDTVSARAGYLTGNFTLQANVSGSWQDDRSGGIGDGTIATYQLTPSYGHGQTQVSTSLQLTQTWRTAVERTDLFSTTLNIRSAWLDNRLTGDLAGTFGWMVKGDDSRNLALSGRLSYGLPEFAGGIKSSVGIRGAYTHGYTATPGSIGRDELSLFAVLTTSVPFVW